MVREFSLHPFRWLTLAAIGGITLMEIVALLTHTDGVLLATAMSIVAGLGGFTVESIGRKAG